MFAKLFAAVTVLAVAQSALAGDCNRKYAAKDGDICDSISAENNVSTYQLATINEGIIDAQCSNLVPGTEYCLGYGSEDCTTTYVVMADDTCEGIAAASNVNTTMLHLNNPQIENDCTNVYVGEVLCVAETLIIPPPPVNMPAKTIPLTAVAAAAAAPTETQKAETHEETYEESYEEVADDDDDEDLPYCDEI